MVGEHNRRQVPRVDWNGSAKVYIGKHALDCEGMDLSVTGIRIRGSWSAYRGQSVKVKLDLDGMTVHAFGEVVWASEATRDGWGIRFTTVHPAAARKIGRFVRKLAADGRTQPAPGEPSSRPARTTQPSGPPKTTAPYATTAPPPPPGPPTPCPPQVRHRIETLLDRGLASGSIVSGAKEAMGGRGELYIRIGAGPVFVLSPEDPICPRLRWLAAAVATWVGVDEERPTHGPGAPLVIRE